jgi:heme A synthase
MRPRPRPIARFAWALLAYQVGVIAWGAYVRATGSGAGCGQHWPLCKGEVVSRSPSAATLIELSHRLSSGLALLLTIALLVWARRAYPIGHRVRLGAVAAVTLMVSEAVIGAGLVLLKLVAHNASLERAVGTSLHLVNTFFLLAATSLTAWWASGGGPVTLRRRGVVTPVLALSLLATLLVATSGALTALGDTLFPSSSVAAGLMQDVAAGASPYVRLRVIHPMLAVATAALVLATMAFVRAHRAQRIVHILSRAAGALAVTQVAAGLLDITLLAPVAMQLLHLVLADLVWIALVLTSAAALVSAPEQVSPAGFPPSRPLLE